MRLRQKQYSKKSIHMAIQPMKQSRRFNQRITSQKMSSPDALLSEKNDALQEDSIKQDIFIQRKQSDDQNLSEDQPNESTIVEQNAQNSKNTIQKEEQYKDKLVNNYIYDHYEFILRPIGNNLILYSIIFLILFVFCQIFWVYKNIITRTYSEELYLKNLMNQRVSIVQKNYQHSFSFLDATREIYQHEVSDLAIQARNQTSCSDFNQRYLCNSSNQFNSEVYKAIDSSYEILSFELRTLITHVNLKNFWVFVENSSGFIQFNLTQFKTEQPYHDSGYYQGDTQSNICFEEVRILSDYIKTLNETTANNTVVSYLDSKTSNVKKYQVFGVYFYQENSTELLFTNSKSYFGVYCLQIPLKYSGTTNKGKICISIPYVRLLTGSQNLLFVNTDINRIQIQNHLIVSQSYSTRYLRTFYKSFQDFIKTEINPQYPQYRLDQTTLIQCLKFHDTFHEMFAEDYISLEIFRCYPTKLLHMLMTKYVFAWSNQETDKLSYHSSPLSLKLEETFEIQSFIISNRTFFKDIYIISNHGVQSIEYTLKFFGIFLIIIIFSFEKSKQIIKDQMIESLFTLKKLSKLVVSIDDVRKSENQFKKILKQLEEKQGMPRTQILGVFIGYLQKFMWIKKLYFYNRRFSHQKSKKNRLLFEGLNLFKYINDQAEVSSIEFQKNYECLSSNQIIRSQQQRDLKKKYQFFQKQMSSENDQVIIKNYKKYPAVLVYIYQQLIYLQLQKIENFQNVKVLSRRRQSSKRKSNQMHILHEIDKDHKQEPKFRYEKEEHNHSQDLSIFGQEIPQISIMDPQPRENRGVRFSNQIQLRGFNNQDEKKSKFRQNILSNSSIGKKSSLKSMKSIEAEVKKKLQESEKFSKSEEDSAAASSTKKLKRETTIKNILRGDESVHEGLKTMKFDQSSNIYDQKQNLNKYSILESSIQENQVELSIDQFTYTHKQIFQESILSYEKITQYYQELIEIKERNLQKLVLNRMISHEQEQEKVNEIYEIEIKRLKTCFKYLKLLLDQSKGDQVDFQQRGINLNFDQLSFYESNYEIQQSLLDKSALYKMKISICLGKTISYKRLEQICRSQNIQVCLEANFLYAQELSKLQPFLDFEVINTCHYCLSNYETSITFKRKCLELMIKTLARKRDEFLDEIDELQLIKRYYNRKHKKFYFVADMTESYDIFTPILTKIYELMGKMDLMQIYNLGMNENLEEMELVRQIIKPQTCEAFLSLFQQLTLDTDKFKEKNSSKIIHKRVVYQKDFNQILDEIQKDQTQFSSFLVIILGGDQLSNHSSFMTDDVDSSNNQRQLNQLLYSQINRKIQKNYYHIIQIGTYLNNFMTKQGKLKKHIKNCSDLLEIDLIKKNLAENYTEIEKFING